MLYAFLLSADPGGCTPEALAERFLDRKLNAAAEQQAEATLALGRTVCEAQLAAQELARFTTISILPLASGAGAHGTNRYPRGYRRSG